MDRLYELKSYIIQFCMPVVGGVSVCGGGGGGGEGGTGLPSGLLGSQILVIMSTNIC